MRSWPSRGPMISIAIARPWASMASSATATVASTPGVGWPVRWLRYDQGPPCNGWSAWEAAASARSRR